jgi:hypothetical protein
MIDFLPPLNSPWGVSFYSFAGSLIYLTRKSFKKTWNAVMKEQYPVTVYESKEAASKEELSTEIKLFLIFYIKKIIFIVFIVFGDFLLNTGYYIFLLILITFTFSLTPLLTSSLEGVIRTLPFSINISSFITAIYLISLKEGLFDPREEGIITTESNKEGSTYEAIKKGIFYTVFVARLLDIE